MTTVADPSPVFTVTEAVYKEAGFHYVLAHVTGTVDGLQEPTACSDVTAAVFVPVDGDWADALRRQGDSNPVVTPHTLSVVRQAVAWWRAQPVAAAQ